MFKEIEDMKHELDWLRIKLLSLKSMIRDSHSIKDSQMKELMREDAEHEKYLIRTEIELIKAKIALCELEFKSNKKWFEFWK